MSMSDAGRVFLFLPCGSIAYMLRIVTIRYAISIPNVFLVQRIYRTITSIMESTSATGCAYTSPLIPIIASKINRAGMNIMPCLLIFMISTSVPAPIAWMAFTNT